MKFRYRNPVRTCVNPNCKHGKAEGLPTGKFQPLHDRQEYCCHECERDHYREDTGRNYRLINERLFKEWQEQQRSERMKLR